MLLESQKKVEELKKKHIIEIDGDTDMGIPQKAFEEDLKNFR